MNAFNNLFERLAPASFLLLELAVSSTVILCVAGVAALLLRRQSAALRHRVWALSMASLLALPAVTLLLPKMGPSWQSIVPRFSSSQAYHGADNATVVTSPVRHDQVYQTGSAAVLIHSRSEVTDGELSIQSSDIPPTDKTRAAGYAATSHEVLSLASRRIANGLVGIWLAGIAIALSVLARCRVTISGLVRSAVEITDSATVRLTEQVGQTVGVRGAVRLLCHPKMAVPVTAGSLRPAIFLPTGYGQWTVDRRRIVLAHELAHIRRQDVLWQAIARLACAIYWFHPLAWLANARMRVEREFACDDAVLELGETPRQYATHLVDVVSALRHGSRIPLAAVAMAASNGLEQRVRAILHPCLRRSPVKRGTGRLLAAAALAAVLAMSLFAPSASTDVAASQAAEPPAANNDIESSTLSALQANEKLPPVPDDAPEGKADGKRKQTEVMPGEVWDGTHFKPVSGKGFIIVPFTTNLQRAMSESYEHGALFLLIHAAPLCNEDDTELSISELDFPRIEAAMVAYVQAGLDLKDKSIVVQILSRPDLPARPGGVTDLFASYLRNRRWTNRPTEVEITSEHAKDWERIVADLSVLPTEEEIQHESGVGDQLVMAYPVVTPLGRYLVGGPENAIFGNVKPFDVMSPEEIQAFPKRVETYLAKLNLGKSPIVCFLMKYGDSQTRGNAAYNALSKGLEDSHVDVWAHALWNDRQRTTPYLHIRLTSQDGGPLKNLTVTATFAPELKASVRFEKEKDDLWRSHGLWGGEDFTLSITATGYKTVTQRMYLPWDTTKEMDIVLEKE